MFEKGTMKDSGIDVTLKNNPKHVLAPDDINILLDFKFNKIGSERFKEYYHALLKNRWETRKEEFLDLARRGKTEDIKLKCPCSNDYVDCHANLAARFLNKLVSKL